MGGRSRNEEFSDRWSWIGELSNDRIDSYGRMTAHKIDNGNSDWGKESLNYELSRRYESIHGFSPEWKR